MRNVDTKDEQTDWQPIKLSGEDGQLIYIEVASQGGREEVGLSEAIPFEEMKKILSSIARSIGDTLEETKAKKAVVELGVEFGIETGKLIALIARGTGKANLKISLEWDRKD